jgi:hypothetical protein
MPAAALTETDNQLCQSVALNVNAAGYLAARFAGKGQRAAAVV